MNLGKSAWIVMAVITVGSGVAAAAAEADFAGQRPIRRDTFNLKFTLSSKAAGAAEICFNLGAEGQGYLLKAGSGKLTLAKLANGKTSLIKETPLHLPAEAVLLVKKRTANIAVFLGDRKLLTADDKTYRGGVCAWKSTGGVSITDAAVQDIGDIVFSDDFMRVTQATGRTTQDVESHGAWKPDGRGWSVMGPGNPETSAAVFQLCHRGAGQQRGVYRTGYWFWDDYIYGASLRFGSADALAALRFYEIDARNYYLLQWDGAAGSVELIRVKDGTPASLAQKQVAFQAQQWYRAKVLVLGDSARAFIDDVPVLAATLPGGICGAIGLEARGRDVRFDDVQVLSVKLTPKELADDTSPALRDALISAENQERLTDAFLHMPTMKEWATNEGAWHPNGPFEWHDSVFYDGTLAWTPGEKDARGTVALLLAPEPGELGKGYRLICSFDVAGGWADVSTFRDGNLVADRRLKGAPRRMDITVEGRRVQLSYGEDVLIKDSLSADYRGFAFGRCIAGNVEKRVGVSAAKSYDYSFTKSPSDWITTGTWELHPRWTCDPHFNWFSGVNRNGPAELWCKRKFEGDYTVEGFIACMLLDQFPHYTVPINFRVTVAADAMKPGSGYTCVFRWVDGPTEILREGKPVAADTSLFDTTLYRDASQARGEPVHRWWVHMKIQKRGNEIRFYIDRKLWLTFTDDKPLAGPFICVSTENNGIMVSRVKITYEKENGKALVTR